MGGARGMDAVSSDLGEPGPDGHAAGTPLAGQAFVVCAPPQAVSVRHLLCSDWGKITEWHSHHAVLVQGPNWARGRARGPALCVAGHTVGLNGRYAAAVSTS